jgi:hypothetical protein
MTAKCVSEQSKGIWDSISERRPLGTHSLVLSGRSLTSWLVTRHNFTVLDISLISFNRIQQLDVLISSVRGILIPPPKREPTWNRVIVTRDPTTTPCALVVSLLHTEMSLALCYTNEIVRGNRKTKTKPTGGERNSDQPRTIDML